MRLYLLVLILFFSFTDRFCYWCALLRFLKGLGDRDLGFGFSDGPGMNSMDMGELWSDMEEFGHM